MSDQNKYWMFRRFDTKVKRDNKRPHQRDIQSADKYLAWNGYLNETNKQIRSKPRQ